MDTPLAPADQEELTVAIVAAFPGRDGLDKLNAIVTTPLGYDLTSELAPAGSAISDVAPALITRTEADGATTVLAGALFTALPGDVLLRAWVQRCRPALIPVPPEGAAAPASDEPLTPADQDELRAAIVAAFPGREGLDNLNAIVSRPLGYDLFARFAGGNAGIEQVVTPLLRQTEGDGATTVLVQTLFVARPYDVRLRNFVRRCRPGIMSLVAQAAYELAMVASVNDGVAALGQAAHSFKDVRAKLDAAHIDLAKVPQEITLLALYKGLHDVLHKVQVPLYRSILDSLDAFTTDPSCPEMLVDYASQLTTLVADARDVLDRGALDDNAGKIESAWIDKLATAATDLGTAADARDKSGVLRQALALKAILRAHPPRLDAALVGAARSIPFDSLIRTMTEVGVSLRDGSPDRLALGEATAALAQLSTDVTARVSEHESWQAIEVNFWATEDAIQRRDDAAVEEFAAYWTVLEEQIGELCSASPGDWVASLNTSATNFRSLFPEPPVPPVEDTARRAFFRYVNVGRLRFYLLDKELKARCDKVARLSQPLSELIQGGRA